VRPEEAVTVIDARGLTEPASADEVLALYLSYADEGDRISVHSPMCRTNLHVAEDCTCTPTVLVVGAKA